MRVTKAVTTYPILDARRQLLDLSCLVAWLALPSMTLLAVLLLPAARTRAAEPMMELALWVGLALFLLFAAAGS